MKMKFEHQTVELPKIKQKNKALPDGGRGYETPEGNLYPSITTVLSIRNKKSLHEWRERVGHDVANYIARTAANRGTAVHKMCEDYLNNQHLAWPSEFDKHKSKNFLAWCMFVQMRDILENVDNIKCLESSLYSDKLGKKLKFRIATSTLRTVEKNGGIDSFLMNAFSKNLSSDARKYKKSISKVTVQNNSKKD